MLLEKMLKMVKEFLKFLNYKDRLQYNSNKFSKHQLMKKMIFWISSSFK